VADVVEMGRNGIDSASEVQVVWEVEVVYACERPGDAELEVKVSSEGELVSNLLYLFVELLPLLGVCAMLELDFVGIEVLGVALGDVAFVSPLGPNLLHNVQHVQVYLPGHLRKEVQHLVHSVVICVLDQPLLDWTLAVPHE